MMHICRARKKGKARKGQNFKRQKRQKINDGAVRDKRKETQERNTQRQMLRDRFSNSAESSFGQVQVMSLIAEELNADSRDCK